MNQDHRETISGIAAAVGAEAIVVLAIFIAAALGCNVWRITSAIGQWVGQ